MEATDLVQTQLYGIPMNENGWIKGGFGLGFADRRISLDLSEPTKTLGGTSDSEAVFTYEFWRPWHMNWNRMGCYPFLQIS